MGGLDRVQIFTLNVLDQRQLQHLRIGDILNDHRNFREPGELGGAPSALAGDDLVAVSDVPDDQRLNDAVGTNRGGQLLQAIWPEDRSRLQRDSALSCQWARVKASCCRAANDWSGTGRYRRGVGWPRWKERGKPSTQRFVCLFGSVCSFSSISLASLI